MRLALMIEGQEGVAWEDWLALARACEEHGVEALFRSDHYLSPTEPGRAALDAWAVIPALAAQTTRLELGTLVSPVTFRPAAVLANASMTANEIAGGRVSLGMGTGWMEAEHEAFGFPFPELRTRLGWLREQLEAVRGFWDEGPQPHLIVGGSGLSGTVDPAAKWADEYNTIFATPAECAERRDKLVAGVRARGPGGDPAVADDGVRDRTDAGRGARADPPASRPRRPARSTRTSTGHNGAPPPSSARSRKPPSSSAPTSGPASRA